MARIFRPHRRFRLPASSLAFAFALVGLVRAVPAGADQAPIADPPLMAEAAAATVVLDSMVVHGRGVAERFFPIAPGVVTVVELDDERGGADLGELLARVAGLQVRRYGGLGAQAVPSIRGSSGAQVQVLVDGLPLADAQNGAVDISLLPLERYATAEIHRGLVPVGFGGIGGAGAVDLRTRPDAHGTSVRLFTGSFGDLGGRVSHGLRSRGGHRRLLVLAHGRRLDNRYGFTPRIPAAQVDLYPDTTWTRANADLEEWGWLASGELEGAPGLLRASVGSFRRDGGRPGPFNLPSPHARVRHERLDARLGAVTRDRDWTADLSLARDRGQLIDTAREVGHDPAGVNTSESDDVLARAIWSPLWRLGAADLGVTAGAEGRLQWYRESIAGDAQPRRNRRSVGAFASASVDLPAWRLGLTPQWRWQRVRDDFPPVPNLPWLPEELGVVHRQDAVSPAVNATVAILPESLILQAHWHHSVRQPTWVELFGQPGGLVGNRELVPEEITGRDVGLRWTLPGRNGVLRATWFSQVTEKTILWYVSGLGQSKPYNVGRTRAAGVELEGACTHRAAEGYVAATYQGAHHGHGQDPVYHGKQLPFLSDWTVFADLGLRLDAWRPGLRLRHESASFTDLFNDPDARVAPRTSLDLSLARTFEGGVWGDGRRATVTAEAINVTDRQLHDVEGYPLPGRSLRLSLHWQ
ncbi:MAG: TonB-dependent receptor [Candidatus Krumholzibacteriia bacterium]